MSAISKMITPDGAAYDIRDANALRAAAVAPSFSDSASYAVGDVVTKDGLVYRCSTAHSAAAWNAAHFTAVDQLIAAGGKVNASLLPAATTSAFGAVKPDGTTITVNNGVITAVGGGGGGGGGVDPRYTYASPTVTTSGTAATVAQLTDRAINAVSLASTITEVTFTFPTATTGKARDFFLRLTITGTPPTIYFKEPEGSAVDPTAANSMFDADDDSWAEIEQGVNIFMFTETTQPSS